MDDMDEGGEELCAVVEEELPPPRWDPHQIDEEERPPVATEEELATMSPLEYVARYGEREFLAYTARLNNCSPGLGRKFVHLTDGEEIKTLRHDEVPVFAYLCVTVLLHELSGSYKFGGFNYHDVAGRLKATTLSLLITALCDPGTGSYFDYTDPFSIPHESFFFDVGGRRFNKVNVLTEALFHKTYVIDDRGVKDDMPLREMFDSKNVKGYRMWFMVADPRLCPTKAIIDRINQNIRLMGLGPRARAIDPYNPVMVAYAQDVASAAAAEDDDIDRTVRETQRICAKEARKINREVARRNKEAKLAEREYRKEMEKNKDVDVRRLSTEVTSLVKFYELICYEERCLFPNCENIKCNECRGKLSVDQAFYNDPQLLPPAQQPSTSWFAPLSRIDYRPVDASTEIGCNLNACLESAAGRSNLLQLIDPCYHFSFANRTTMKLCAVEGIEVCPEQLDPERYSTRDELNRRVFRVPFDFAIFVFTPQTVTHPNFFEMRMPWCIDLRDFVITAIESYARAQRRRFDAEHARRFFENIDLDNSETRAASAVSEYWRRFIPASVPAALSGGEYDKTHDVTAVCALPTRQQQTEIDDNIVNITDVFDREGARFREYVTRLRNCSKSLNSKEQQIVISIIRGEGRRIFKSIFREHEQNTRVCKAAIKLLNTLSKNDESAFHSIPIVAKNMPSTFGNYLIQQYAMAEGAGLLYTHTLFLMLRWSVMRAAHCHETDAFFGMITLIYNICLFGVAGAGKTFAAKVAGDYLLYGAIQIISSSSDASFTDMQSQSDMLKLFDEMRAAVCPGPNKRPDARDDMHLNLLKEMMTAHRSTRRITLIGKDGNILDRKVVTILGVDHSAIGLFGNDAITFAGEDSYWTRYAIYVVAKAAERYGSGDIASQTVRAGCGSITSNVRSPHAQRQQWARTEHALNVAINRQIRVGALPYPNLDVFTYMWGLAYNTLKKVFPSVSGMNRAAERVASLVVTLVITHAIYLVFNSIWSPLIQILPDMDVLRTDPYSHEQLCAVAPLLRADEDTCIYAITKCLEVDFCPPENHAIADGIAKTFGMLGTSTPQYTKHIFNNQEYQNPNYVNCGTGVQIVKYIESKFGHNRFTAMHILGLLLKTTVEVDYINPVNTALPPTKRVVDAVVRHNNQEQGRGSPEQDMLNGIFHVSVEYVEKWTPKAVLKLVMDAMCHDKIQPRQVVIGSTIDKLPFLPNVWQVSPGRHSVNLSSFNETKTYMKDALVGNYSITREGEEHRHNMESGGVPIVDAGADPETYLMVRWLKENVDLPEGIDPKYYTRRVIERATEKRIKEWFPVAATARRMYPEDVVEEYMRGAVNMETAARPGSSILEEDMGPIAKKRAPPPSSSSSASSSSSRVEDDNLCATRVTKRPERATTSPLDTLLAASKRPRI